MVVALPPAAVNIDWNKSGTFTGLDVVTNDVRGIVRLTFGRDPVTAVAGITAGRGSLTLDNSSRKYSPRNASSPLSPNVKPARPVLITRTVLGTTYTLFRGRTDLAPINPDVDAKTVSLSLVDALMDFEGQSVTTDLYPSVRSGEAVGIVLDTIGWTAGRDIDTGSSMFPWWWENGTDALEALRKIVASEGPPALMTIGTAGEFVFRDRQHRRVRSASLNVQKTFRGGDRDPEPRMATGFQVDEAWTNVVNNVDVGIDERRPQAAMSTVWETDEQFSFAASESKVFVISTADPFYGAVTPEEGIDFDLLSGLILSTSISRTSGGSTSVTLTADITGAVIIGLALRAHSVPVVRSLRATATDATSIADYGRRGLPSGSEPVLANRYDAQAIVDVHVAQRKQPLPVATVRFVCGLGDDQRLAALLSLDLSDRVRSIEPETSTDAHFFVESIEHEVVSAVEHVIVLGLEAAPSLPAGTPFVLDSSTLNGTAVLGT